MKITPFIKYFWFITKNWNPRLALFTIVHEIKGEKKYGIDTMTVDRLKSLSVKGDNKEHASIYQGAGYFLLEEAFNYLQEIEAKGALVDYGSGKGRIMAVAAHHGYTKITGIDFAAGLCNIAEQNINKIKPQFPETEFLIICDDALNYVIDKNDSIFFFFNPFDEVLMLKVVKKMMKSFKDHEREMVVVYINPMHKDIFQSAGFVEEYYIEKLTYQEMSILILSPNSDDDTEQEVD